MKRNGYYVSAHILFSLCMALLLSSCATRLNMKEQPIYECPDPFIPCTPGAFNEVTFDTTSSGYGYYLVIDRVEGLDGDDDEFGVAFATGNSPRTDGLATIKKSEGKESHDEIHRVRFTSVTSALPQKVFETRDLLGSMGTPAYSPSADTMLISGQLPGTVKGDYDIVGVKVKQQDRLAEAKRQPVSTFIHWDAQPAFSPDGRIMYFASGRLDAIGGTDIYISRLQSNGSWSEPENIGPGVNTPCDELSPFVSSDGKWLYFSSSGHKTVGGYDIFRAPLAGGVPGQTENLGRPINTPSDELFPSAPAGASPDTLLYYSSNQKGSNGFDLYVLHLGFRKRPGSAGTEKPDSLRLTGTIRYNNGQPVDGATVTLDERDPPRRVDSAQSDNQGKYEFDIQEGKKYDITASKEGKLYGTETVEVPVYNNKGEVNRDVVFLDTVVFRVNFPFNDASNPYEYTLDERGLPTDRRWSDVIAQAAEVLRRVDPTSGTKIELVGHTDPIGSDAYNVDLGRRRAEFIRRELVRRGVSPELLVVRTEGERRPLPAYPNEADELYRARLRRVELFRK
ncbi:MAG: OmpA family protein [Candidatus Kapaibacterium sp.]